MKIPKEVKRYCPKCKAHKAFRLKVFKPGAPRQMSAGQRRHARKEKVGYGGKSKFIATVKKQSKKPTFVAECTTCKKKISFSLGKRMKPVEIVAA